VELGPFEKITFFPPDPLLVFDTNKISTTFSPNPSSRIKKGEIEENAFHYLLLAKNLPCFANYKKGSHYAMSMFWLPPIISPLFPPIQCLPVAVRVDGALRKDENMYVGSHTRTFTLPVLPLTVPVTLPITVM
jgi:hypothetical protein